MKPRLRLHVEAIPTTDYPILMDQALECLSGALAAHFLEGARAEVAAELGVAPEELERDRCLPLDGQDLLEGMGLALGGGS